MRRFVCAAIVVAFTFSVALADDFVAIVKKVEDRKVTYTKLKEKEEHTLLLAKDAKIYRGAMFDKESKKIKGGDEIKASELAEVLKEAKKGRLARIVTKGEGDKERITTIRLPKKKEKTDKDGK